MPSGKRKDSEIEAITLQRVDAPQASGSHPAERGHAAQAAPARRWGEPAPQEDPPRVDLASLLPDDSDDGRYDLHSLIGEGGMGRIHLSRDRRIGRDVAMKILRQEFRSQPDALARFLREARIQGQLEHPSIVPVYDLGRRPDGSVFFTMKRVRGKTLEEIVDGYLAGDPDVMQRYSRRKLLRAFGAACLAVDFAHKRGVLHRDLKPGNIMLGDYGEVYVLDWGLSKVSGFADVPPDDRVDVPMDPKSRTIDGAVMGTPGYMSPEQARGLSHTMDERADVYSLGAILYEMLSLQPLHARGSVSGIMTSTVRGADARPSFRAPQRAIAPELDAICVKATHVDPQQRMASARELADAIERYLDGEEDMALRKEMAQAHTEAADVAAEYAFAGGANANEERIRALREVGRALALDPANADARRIMVKLLAQPPSELPDEERAEVETQIADIGRLSAMIGGYYNLGFLAVVGFVLWMGVESWPSLLLYVLASGGTAVISFLTSRGLLPGPNALVVNIIAHTFSIACMSTMFGPLFLIPGLAAVTTMAHIVNAGTSRQMRHLVTGIGLLAVLVPLGLEVVGLLPPSYAFREGVLMILPRMHGFPESATVAFLLYIAVAHIVATSVLFSRVQSSLFAAELRLHTYTWQLKQLVPDEARHIAERLTSFKS